ncbi:FAD-dependent oxidoreductase [Nonomuraea sp. NPDC049758]|uniref:FAD-dependent oxidoreductase n=1 Tax=Nonomuraea sp. NPDC049758 TaxID=3154360 RepID=UPI00344659FE
MSRTVAIIGGGYGGAAAAKALDEHADVVLVEPKDAFVQNAASMRALARPEWAGKMFFPYDRLMERGRIVRERAVSVDSRGVLLASGERVEADHLVLATGSGYPFPFKFEDDLAGQARERIHAVHGELAGAGRVLIAGPGRSGRGGPSRSPSGPRRGSCRPTSGSARTACASGPATSMATSATRARPAATYG